MSCTGGLDVQSGIYDAACGSSELGTGLTAVPLSAGDSAEFHAHVAAVPPDTASRQ